MLGQRADPVMFSYQAHELCECIIILLRCNVHAIYSCHNSLFQACWRVDSTIFLMLKETLGGLHGVLSLHHSPPPKWNWYHNSIMINKTINSCIEVIDGSTDQEKCRYTCGGYCRKNDIWEQFGCRYVWECHLKCHDFLVSSLLSSLRSGFNSFVPNSVVYNYVFKCSTYIN